MMKDFIALYNMVCTEFKIIEEAYAQGLELKAKTFFYDPKTASYNDEFREKFLLKKKRKQIPSFR